MFTLTLDEVAVAVRDMDTDEAQAALEDALSYAYDLAPCLAAETFNDDAKAATARAVIRAALKRSATTDDGALSSWTAGPFGAGMDTRRGTANTFTRAEADRLRSLCRDGGRAFSISTIPTRPSQ